jgi:rhamnosyltransferase
MISRLFSLPDIPGVTRWQRWSARACHLRDKVAVLTLGALVVGPLGRAWRLRLDRDAPKPLFAGSVALVAHVFYPDILEEILACFSHLPDGSALLVTTPPEAAEAVSRALAGCPKARILAAANRGRDIAPFLGLLDDGALDGFDVVLKLHTKRSPHLRDGEIRRRLLFTRLAGSRRRVARVLDAFADPSTGIVGWRAAWRASPLFWMRNRARVEALAARMGMPVAAAPAFFEGSMFWARPRALARLRAARLRLEEFEPEAGQVDGALHHGVERVFVPAILAAGFTARDLGGRVLMAPEAQAAMADAAVATA